MITVILILLGLNLIVHPGCRTLGTDCEILEPAGWMLLIVASWRESRRRDFLPKYKGKDRDR